MFGNTGFDMSASSDRPRKAPAADKYCKAGLHELIELAANATRTGIAVTDAGGRVVYMNPAFASVQGHFPDELVPGRWPSPASLAPGPVPDDVTKSDGTWIREGKCVRVDGADAVVRLMSDVLRDGSGMFIGVVTTCEDITDSKRLTYELERRQVRLEELVEERTNELETAVEVLAKEVLERRRNAQEIKRLAYYDSLTGLPNRTYLSEQLFHALKNADRADSCVALLHIDIDNFKRVNDTLGHTTGDTLLKSVGSRLAGCLRKSDPLFMTDGLEMRPIVSRLGGDEFIVLIPEIADLDDAMKVTARIMESMSAPFELECHEIFITLSIGVTFCPLHGNDADVLMMKADTALYHAKESGKNRYAVYREAMTQSTMSQLVMENDLHKALLGNELAVHYQPLYDLRSGRVLSMEALLRWQHPGHGPISPVDFIPVAEQCGLIIPIGDWALCEVLRQIKQWTDDGLDPVPIAVNLSVSQLTQYDIVGRICSLLDKYSLHPGCIEIEVTESTLMKDPDETIKHLGRFKSMGINVYIDDFGTGYSSLSYLGRLPLNALKIDRSFVMGVHDEENAGSIARAVIALGHTLGLKVVAEGVETVQQLAFLKEHGCDIVQGFHFCRPLDAPEAGRLLKER